MRFGKTVLSFEAVDYVSGFTRRPTYEYTPLSQRAFGEMHHDLFFSIGLKVPTFGK